MLTVTAQKARQAFKQLARCSTSQVNLGLLTIAEDLWEKRREILAANQEDVVQAQQNGLKSSLVDRLALNEGKLRIILADLRGVAALPDPVGEVFDQRTLPNGLRIHKLRIPLGVLGVIYESRPNVTLDVTGLALKTHNAAILRGGSETLNTNRILVNLVRSALLQSGLPGDAVQLIDNPDRALVLELLKMDKEVDLIIPRGSNALQQFCRDNSRIPVIYGGIGICHLFVDASADLSRAVDVLRNAKIQAPSVCNALDVALVHKDIATEFIPNLVSALAADGVSFRFDSEAWRLCPPENLPAQQAIFIQPAGTGDFDTEWLSLTLSVKVVSSLDEAIDHIETHSTHHSDGILTSQAEHARQFLAQVDSAAVYANASTRFTDGGQLGLGTEVAISTQRLHARGPMGLQELTTYKWVVEGDYHTRP